jgi:hypothetical protein
MYPDTNNNYSPWYLWRNINRKKKT